MNITEIIAVGLCILLAVVMVALIAAGYYDSNTREMPKVDLKKSTDNKSDDADDDGWYEE